MTEQEFFFQTWSREMPKFDSVMNALDPARLDYRPHPKSRSAAEMVTLLARFQEMLVGMMETGVIDYKDFQSLRRYLSDRGKIRSRRITGACRRHQNQLAKAVKRARELALLPYVVER